MSPESKAQKKLLKNLKHLFKKYIIYQTPYTNAFLADPGKSAYDKMYKELAKIVPVIDDTKRLKELDTDKHHAKSRLIAFDCGGLVAFDSDKKENINSYNNYITKDGDGNKITSSNYGTRKGTQQLNIYENLEVVYQVKPTLAKAAEITEFVTEAGAYERAGFPGIFNTGFIRLTIEVDINAYPFNLNECKNNKE